MLGAMLNIFASPTPQMGVVAGLASPVFAFTSDATYAYSTWTWGGTDPDHWTIQSSTDTVTWADIYNVAGNLRAQNIVLASADEYYRVVGRDAGNANITGISNTIAIVDPITLNPVATGSSGQIDWTWPYADPGQWIIESSDTATWTPIASDDGSLRSRGSLDGLPQVRVSGWTADGLTRLTGYSNTVPTT